ncbi:MAG: DUF3078 domain-containing protein [Bacteroidales bacterium]|nr:DUF3078 domain-containing protein [Bacteroidales bacterium]
MKKFLLFIAIGLIAITSNAQNDADTAWKKGGDFSLMFAETGYENWAAGGENSISLNSFFNLFAYYAKGKSKWENDIALAYGQIKTGKREFRKSEDKIDLSSKYGIKATDKLYYSSLFNFKSQFATGYEYPGDTMDVKISDFLAPAYISIGIGIEYVPVDYLSIYFSPATARWIIVNDQDLANAGAFGVEGAEFDDQGNMTKEGEKSKFEFGGLTRIVFKKDIVKNVSFQSKLEMFSNYLENPQNIDVNWDNILNMKINDFLSANLTAQLLYDHDTKILDKDGKLGPRTQFKHTIGVGLSYKF